jgi:hypothetical protein
LWDFTPPHFASPGLAFASPYSGWQNVANLERYMPLGLDVFAIK